MGAAVGGVFGAGGGLVLGLITGLLTADAHQANLQAKVATAQSKDRELEAQLEREIERQRELEAHVGGGQVPSQPTGQTGTKPLQGGVAKRADEVRTAKKTEAPTALPAPDGDRSSSPSSSRPFKNVEIKDVNGDGIPDLWIYYNPLKADEIVRQEEATKGDGRVDVWSYSKNGKLVRREVDNRGDGRPDTIYYYDDEKLVREERDETGEGRVTYRGQYHDGRLARIERSTRADGKVDLWVDYDTAKEAEVVLKEERDLNGDAGVDLWSYYENGRLVRRDVSALGLEYLSKTEKLPSGASAELEQLSRSSLPRTHAAIPSP